jgi:hypothetical protein
MSDFNYPANARELKRPESPLAKQYSTTDFPHGYEISRAGVVVPLPEPVQNRP